MQIIYLDSLKIHDNTDNNFGFFVEQPIRGLESPNIRRASFERPGEDGAYVSNVLLGERRIILQGVVYGSTAAAHEDNRIALEAALIPTHTADGRPVPMILKFTTLGGRSLQIEVYLLGKPRLDLANNRHSRFYLEFEAPEWPLVSQTENSQLVDLPVASGITYPVTYPVTYGAVTGGSIVVSNNGNGRAYPVIEFAGPLTNPYIRNATTDRTFQLTMTIATGETVTIDMLDKTVLKGTSSQFDKITGGSDWWWLEPGNNTIEFDSTSGGDSGTATVKYRHSYMGI